MNTTERIVYLRKMKLIILKLNNPHEIFILSETEMDLLLLLVWIIPIIIFVAFGQQIQLYMTSIELKKDQKNKNIRKSISF